MSHATASNPNSPTEAEAEFVWPEFNPSPAHRNFIERLRLARLERGLSIADMSDEVGLTFRLANEFESLTTPLPFDYLELWCQVVGVPFDDYLAIYRADERAWDERQAEKKAAREREVRETPCLTNTEATDTEAPTPAPTSVSRGFGFLNLLRSIAAHIANRMRSRFFTPKETPE